MAIKEINNLLLLFAIILILCFLLLLTTTYLTVLDAIPAIILSIAFIILIYLILYVSLKDLRLHADNNNYKKFLSLTISSAIGVIIVFGLFYLTIETTSEGIDYSITNDRFIKINTLIFDEFSKKVSDCFYHSGLTITTLGYSDEHLQMCNSWLARFWSILEASIGMLYFGLLVNFLHICIRPPKKD